MYDRGFFWKVITCTTVVDYLNELHNVYIYINKSITYVFTCCVFFILNSYFCNFEISVRQGFF